MVKKPLMKREIWISLFLIVAVILVWAVVLIIEIPHSSTLRPGQPLECDIEYGSSECINGSLVTSFYNPGNKDITKVSMYFRDGDDVDIYNCKEPLKPDFPSTLTTILCTEDIDTSNVWLVWCCGENCFDTYMTDVSDDLSFIYP